MRIPQVFSIKHLKRSHLVLALTGGVFLFLVLGTTNPFIKVSQAITLSPPRLELAGDPGSTVSGEIKVTNDSNGVITYYTQVENFEAGDETGNPAFVVAKEGLATWVNVSDSVFAKAGEQVAIPFSIKIPRSTEPGGYFASIFVRTTPPPRNGGEVSIGARLGSLILLRVNGDIQEGVNILEFSSKNKQRFYTSLPVELYYRFQNTGADRVKPEGNIIIKNLIGMTAKTLSANRSEGSVLPRSIRRFESSWITSGGNKEDVNLPTPSPISGGFFTQAKHQLTNFAFGYYKADLDIRFGENNNSATDSFRFFVFPWQLLITALVVFVVGFLLLRFLLRRYNRRIIAKHSGQ